MSTQNAILLLGTNLGNKKKNLETAIILLEEFAGTVIKQGVVTETKPVEFTSESMFLNQLISLKTELSPFNLLKIVKDIEQKMGRVYSTPLVGEKYISRVIDIDILFYDDMSYISKKLQIPHKQVETRSFVFDMLNVYKES